MLDDNISQRHLLPHASLLKAPLHDAAAMLVGADLLAVAHTGFKDKLCECCAAFRPFQVCVGRLITTLKCIKECLNDVVAIYMRAQLEDFEVYFLDKTTTLDFEPFDVLCKRLDQRLHGSSSMHA